MAKRQARRRSLAPSEKEEDRKTEPCNLPVTTKRSGDGEAPKAGFFWGYSSMQGWRESNEDTHLAIPNLDAFVKSGEGAATLASRKAVPVAQASGCGSRVFTPGSRVSSSLSSASKQRKDWANTALFVVMDGHGGQQVARFCQKHLPCEVAEHSSDDVPTAFASTFSKLDAMLANHLNLRELATLTQRGERARGAQLTGCTAVACCLRPDEIVVANVGDSRAVLCRGGKAIDLSHDHKPELPSEKARIEKCEAWIVEEQLGGTSFYKINGELGVSRAVGDLKYKKDKAIPQDEQIVISVPDVECFRRQADDDFIIVACDGIWEVLSSQEVVDQVLSHLPKWRDGSLTLSAIIEGVFDRCLSPDLDKTGGLGGDNMTMLIIALTK